MENLNEELKVGDFVRWVAQRLTKSWNTFGKVIKVTEDEVTILTYDDNTETTLNKRGESVTNEISIASEDEVDDFILITLANLNKEKLSIELQSKLDINKVDKLISSLENL